MLCGVPLILLSTNTRMASMCYLNYALESSSLRDVGANAMPSESSSASESTS